MAPPPARLAGYAFFAFVLLQIPCFMMETSRSPSGFVVISPIEVTAAEITDHYPSALPVMQGLLFPGTWVRNCLSRYLLCLWKERNLGACDSHSGNLWNWDYVLLRTQLPQLVSLLNDPKEFPQRLWISLGCAVIFLTGMFSLVTRVRMAVIGFLILAYGLVMGNLVPLPPGVMMAFLVSYAAFSSGPAAPVQKPRIQGVDSQGSDKKGSARALKKRA